MRFFILLCLLSLRAESFAQKYWSSQSAEVSFFSDAPLENIKAISQTAGILIDTETNEIAVKIGIKSFKFQKELMQEHFNENYMESEKFPYGTFSGKINDPIDWRKSGKYQVTATGKLTIHGVTQDRTLSGTLKVEPDKISLDSKFDVLLVNHNITIPKIVFQKIAERIDVSLKAKMLPYSPPKQ